MNENNDVEAMHLYTERETRRIFEALLFDSFAIVRPVDPRYHSDIRKIGFDELANEFDEYSGNMDQVRNALSGGAEVVVLN